MLKRAVSASALGNCMEWFDFGVYSYLVGTIGDVFFSGAGEGGKLISSFATFAAAFVVRPLGGLFFGPLGDKLGRKRVLAMTMIMMACGTFAIGFIPGYDSIGIAAPILLLLARMLQGFSTGGEYGGATTFIAEYSPDKRRGFMGSFLDFGTFVGYALGSSVVTLLNAVLTDAEMISWGWRIPFLVAGPLGIIGLYMRLKLEDSPAFRQQLDEHDKQVTERETERHEFRTIFTKYWRGLLVCVGLVLLYNVTNYMVTGYMVTYVTKELGRSTSTGDMLVLFGMIFVVLTIVFVGRLSDRIGRRPVFTIAAIIQIFVAIPCFLLIKQPGFLLPLIGVLVLCGLLAMVAAPTAATLPALFPTNIRYAAMGIGFNLGVSAFGGTTPLLTETLVDKVNISTNELIPAYYLMVSGALGLVAVFFLRETSLLPLKGSQPLVDSEQEAEELVETTEKVVDQLRQENEVGAAGSESAGSAEAAGSADGTTRDAGDGTSSDTGAGGSSTSADDTSADEGNSRDT